MDTNLILFIRQHILSLSHSKYAGPVSSRTGYFPVVLIKLNEVIKNVK